VSFVPPGVGETPYNLVGTGAYWSRRGAEFLGRLLGRLWPEQRLKAARLAVKVRRVSELSPVSRVGIRLWIAWVFAWRTRWADFDWYVSVHSGRRILGIAGVVDRMGTVGGTPARLGLLGGVFTIPEERTRGLGTDVVRRATRLVEHDLKCDFGVLICSDRLAPFYARLGWKRVPNVMTFERFGRKGAIRGRVMVYECAGRPLPEGVIDVKGLPA
jgi:GNAT superfamily N-acetyltransferase